MTPFDRYFGHLDRMENGLVSGWAIDRHRPAEPCLVDLYVNGSRVGEFAADLDRPDLAEVSPEDTRKGFAIDLRRGWRSGDRVEALFGGTTIRLPSGAAAGASGVDPQAFAQALATPFVPIPEPSLIAHVGGARTGDLAENYRAVGSSIAADIYNVLRQYGCDIGRSDFHLVDLGCGCGRIAGFLAGFLRRGRYSGFDIWQEGISWAQRHISPIARRMSFRALTPERLGYEGRRAFALPLAAASADAVVAVSLFTHLDRGAMRVYLGEIGRVLRPGGFLYLTAYLRDPESLAKIRERHGGEGVRLEESGVSSFAAGGYLDSYVDRDFLEHAIARGGMAAIGVRYGSWRGAHRASLNTAAFQDLVVARGAGGLDSGAAIPL